MNEKVDSSSKREKEGKKEKANKGEGFKCQSLHLVVDDVFENLCPLMC